MHLHWRAKNSRPTTGDQRHPPLGAYLYVVECSDHHSRPDFTNTEPAVPLGPFPQWGDKKKIVAMDPWGHLAPTLWKDEIDNQNGTLDGKQLLFQLSPVSLPFG